ncbi:hypothetical protein V8C35DRAFT_290494 [Trichoderma chlorosporum]
MNSSNAAFYLVTTIYSFLADYLNPTTLLLRFPRFMTFFNPITHWFHLFFYSTLPIFVNSIVFLGALQLHPRLFFCSCFSVQSSSQLQVAVRLLHQKWLWLQHAEAAAFALRLSCFSCFLCLCKLVIKPLCRLWNSQLG